MSVLALLAPALLIAGFVLLKAAPIFGVLVMVLAVWLAIHAEDEDEAVLYRLVGWGVVLALLYLGFSALS